MKYIKLLFLLIGLNGILCAQSSIQDSIYYTDKQDINCLRCLKTEQLKDSLIVTYKLQVKTADTIINGLQFANQELTTNLTNEGKKVVKLRWNVLKGVIGGLVVGFFTGVFIRL